MEGINIMQGQLVGTHKYRFGIVAARFNDLVVSRLLTGAVDTLQRHGISKITVVRVPGAWEIPLACDKLAAQKSIDAVIALGAVIRGSTPHFDFVASEVAKGCTQTMLHTKKPIAFGVLTTDTLEQAVERAGAKMGNKGAEAALAALEMTDLVRQL